MHDVWVNWFEGEENGYLVPHFHEWSKGDGVELMDQIPLLKVNENLHTYIEFGLRKTPTEILSKVINKAYLLINGKREQVKYSFVITDGKRVLAVQLNENGVVEKKSRLIPRQDALALEMTEDYDNDFVLKSKVNISKYNTFPGLTRYEKSVQRVAAEFINSIHPSRLGLLKYLLSEFDLRLHKTLTGTFDEIKHIFLEVIRDSEIGKLNEFNKVINKIKLVN